MYAAGHGIKPWRADRAGGVRLGRVLAASLLVGIAAVAMAAGVHGGGTPSYSTVVVQQGDTLWSIAAEHYPGDDVRGRVQDIEAANGLSGPQIEAGETLRLPG